MESAPNQDLDADDDNNDIVIQDQLILLAASHHDIETLRTLLRTGSASVQDPETGFTPLHAAIAACEDDQGTTNPSATTAVNGAQGNAETVELEMAKSDVDVARAAAVEGAAKTMKLLLQRGAIWNDVDKGNETPGCLALRLGFMELYEVMVDAGVRAEMLLNRLDEYEQLAGDEEDEGEDVDVDVDEKTAEASNGPINGDQNDEHLRTAEGETQPTTRATTTAHEPDLNNDAFLQSSLRFQDGRLLDDANNGVMMAWETDLMRRSADRLAPRMGLRILNIGHGMGIIDTFFHDTYPSAHHIIEAHPAVIARMKKDGWDKKENVTIHEGRWQDVIPKLIEQHGSSDEGEEGDPLLFDAIYFDTFAEDYKALRTFFSDFVVGLLKDDGRWGFFNGMGADRQICYDVYGKLVEMDLFEAGYDTEWETIEVDKLGDEEWYGVKRPYWALKEYRLPICTFIS